MQEYELRFLDRLDVVVTVRPAMAPDDLGAVAEAERVSATHTIEIWQDERLVARVKKGSNPSEPAALS